MEQLETAGAEWRRHWPMVLAACIGFSFMSFMTAAAGVFMDPLATEFHWGRTELSAGMAIASLLSILCSPFIGILIDRHGSRRLALPGLVLTSLAIAAFSQVNGSIPQWLALWVIWGVVALLVQSTLWSAAIASVFRVGRGLALGVTMSGTALAQVVAPPLSNALIEAFGWRTAYIALGLGWGGLALVLSALFLFDVRDQARRRQSQGKGPPEAAPDLPGLGIGEAWRDISLWKVAVATFLVLTVTIAVVVHQFPILVEAGMSRSQAAWLVSLSGVAGVMGKLVSGTLIDRFHARTVGGITLASTAVGWPLLMQGIATPVTIVIGIMISGYAAGTKIQLCSYLTARYAGMRHYGTIFGFMTSVIALASAIGPLAAGLSYDRYGSYTPLLLAGVAISLISGGLVFSLRPYPEWRAATAAPA
ncbi:MFS transporter [Novosphingobium sp. RL4]|uniref:MFS transporter n=1 Tax=Novosphingobium sp. RL4 TaxID=3109595 RepID=UPI002D7782ED|nr:MFS transporter [Novosphingobium sp. RL4]WRT94919.1 MFS transporter [Novosphingobium sp. RL4]